MLGKPHILSLLALVFFMYSLAFYLFSLFSPAHLINSIKHEHSCKILFICNKRSTHVGSSIYYRENKPGISNFWLYAQIKDASDLELCGSHCPEGIPHQLSIALVFLCIAGFQFFCRNFAQHVPFTDCLMRTQSITNIPIVSYSIFASLFKVPCSW